MAFQDKVVKLSYDQLKDLTKKYESKSSQSNATQFEQAKNTESSKSRNKRPEREIYRPVRRTPQRHVTGGEFEEDEEDSTQYEQLADVQAIEQSVQEMGVNSDRKAAADVTGADHMRGGKRRQKRPDMQIYRPRAVHQHSGSSPADSQQDDTTPEHRYPETQSIQNPDAGNKSQHYKYQEHDLREQNGIHYAPNSGRQNNEKKEFRKAYSLDWDERPGSERLHGDCMADRENARQTDSSSNRGQKKRRERRSSGQKQWEDCRGSISKGQGLSNVDRKQSTRSVDNSKPAMSIPSTSITTDAQVQESIDNGTFRGLVFTQSKKVESDVDQSRENCSNLKLKPLPASSDAKDIVDVKESSHTDLSGLDAGLSWGDQVELAEADETLETETDITEEANSVSHKQDSRRQKGQDRSLHVGSDHGGARSGGKSEGNDDNAKKHVQLKVTFASGSERRKVLLSNLGRSGSEEKEVVQPHQQKRHSGDNKMHNKTKSPGDASKSGRGGLIKLPMNNETQKQSNPRSGHTQHQRVPRGRARGGSHFTLYDPKNPNKPMQLSTSPKGLHFHDPTEQHQTSPPTHAMPYFPDQYYQGEYQNFYGYPGAMQAAYYNMGAPPRMPLPGQPPPHILHQMYERCVIMRPDDYTRDLHGRRGFDQESASSHVSAEYRSRAETLLKEIQPMDIQLSNIITHGLCHDEALEKIEILRRDIQDRFEQVILLDAEVCNNQNLDQLLWKCVFYQVIEMLRKHVTDNGDGKLKDYLLNLLEEGTRFYEKLLDSLQSTYQFDLDDFTDINVPAPDNLSRMTKLALYCAQKAMIFLGDIARYKEQINQTANFGKARNWYMRAQQIAPKNGRPYNQLAILALYTRRKLDAVYYYMRSLAASNPFLTARESLMSLFDDARKRAEGTEKKRMQELTERRKQQKRSNHRHKSQGHRVEIWVSPDGSTLQDEISPGADDLENLTKISAVELNRRFILSFLNVHGKLFTKVGMENFPEVSSQMLHEFKALLSHSPCPIGNIRLLQLVTINMFAIENAIAKAETASMEDNCRSLHQEYAVQLMLDMFGLMVDRCVQLLEVHLQSGNCQILSDDLHCLFPSVKVCADWMTCHADDWNPPPMPRDPDLGPAIDVWNALADLFNTLKQVLIAHVKLYPSKKEGCDPIVLPEDVSLAGFTPLLSLPQMTMFVHSTVDKDISRDCLRVDKLCLFGDYLCGIEPPLLSYDVAAQQYVSIAPESTVTESEQEINTAMHNDDVIVESDSCEEPEHNTSFGSSGDESQIKTLRARKQQLEKEMEKKEKQQRNIRAVLDDTDNSHIIEIEVRPLMLVPDTNCFIDHLHIIKQLLASKKFTIVVPLVVINELDGLARGSREGQYDTLEHAQMVYTGAQRTIAYLEEQFEVRHSHLRALTSKGSVLDTITYRAEETSDEGNNDDLILSCCLHYCQDMARDFMPKSSNEPIRLQRVVVLLTDDRNLRLKAHTRNVPVKDLPSFMSWANIG